LIVIEARTADDAWRQAGILLQNKTEVQPGRDQPTRELLHVAFSIADPPQRVVFARPFNPALAIAEVIWILAGGNASEFIMFWNPRLRHYLDADPCVFHGAYGSRLGSRPRLPNNAELALRVANGTESLDQLRLAYEALQANRDSRQIVLQIWDSGLDLPDSEPRSADVPCNLMSHLLIRGDRLEWLQVMRSNDLIWGTPYNFIQFTSLQEIVAGWLGVDVGSYVQLSDSLHVYQRHWCELDSLIFCEDRNLPKNSVDLRIAGYDSWEQVFGIVADAASALAKDVGPDEALEILDRTHGLPEAYKEWIALLAAESLRRSGHEASAVSLVHRAGHYWAESWRRWHARTLEAVQVTRG
jgi:thymidylate synthase